MEGAGITPPWVYGENKVLCFFLLKAAGIVRVPAQPTHKFTNKKRPMQQHSLYEVEIAPLAGALAHQLRTL